MNEIFQLSLTFNTQAYSFQVTAQEWGDSRRYAVNVDDVGLLFQPDVYSDLTYFVVPGQSGKTIKLNTELLNAIGKALEARNSASIWLKV